MLGDLNICVNELLKYVVVEFSGKVTRIFTNSTMYVYSNTKLIGIYETKNDKPHGNGKIYENGKVIIQNTYKNGLLHGIYKSLYGVSYYKRGKLHGKNLTYNNGVLIRQMQFKNDIMDGVYKEWYENGNRKFVCHYKYNKLHGSYRGWYINGQISLSANYHYDLLCGRRRKWDTNGKLICDEQHYLPQVFGFNKDYSDVP